MAKRSPMPADAAVGENIRTARLAAGVSQAELGAACGVTFQQIQKYEKGRNRVDGSRLMQIAEALKVPAATLLPPPRSRQSRPSIARRRSFRTASAGHRERLGQP